MRAVAREGRKETEMDWQTKPLAAFEEYERLTHEYLEAIRMARREVIQRELDARAGVQSPCR